MTVEVATGSIGTRAVDKDYPIDEGLIAGTTRQKTESPSLEAEEKAMEEGWGGV